MRQLLISTIAILCGFTGCSQKPADNKAIIVGMYCGECHRNCSAMAKISRNNVQVDTTRAFFNWLFDQQPTTYQFFDSNSGIRVSDSTQRFTKQLLDKIPNNIESYEQTIGCPDCADGCGIYLSVNNRHWLIDTGGHDDPELEQFVDLTIESMNKVHEEVFRNR